MPPKDFPPHPTVQGDFYQWRDDGPPSKHASAGEAGGREASPTAGVIDSQSVKTTEAGAPRGYDAAKTVKGRKRHILTDGGRGTGHPAGAVALLASTRTLFAALRHVFAESAYAAQELSAALAAMGDRTLEIIKPSIPPEASCCCRGVGWPSALSLVRSTSAPRQRLRGNPASAEAWLSIASIKLHSRRLAQR